MSAMSACVCFSSKHVYLCCFVAEMSEGVVSSYLQLQSNFFFVFSFRKLVHGATEVDISW